MLFSPYFKQKVSDEESIVKISDEIPRNHKETINTVVYTKKLDQVFKYNRKHDKSLRWQYFGSSKGLIRLYPAREWDTNFAGFYNDYDPRVRNWYIAATSGPKDVIIIIDCSLSMYGKKFEIAKSVAKAVIDTLTAHDYINVICARESHWDEVGKSQSYKTEVLSCQQNRIVQATLAHKRDLKEKVSDLVAGGTTELE
jgi:voltage-dependent calcium channel alpha-2/delta-3